MLEFIYSVLFSSSCIGCKKGGDALCDTCKKSLTRALPGEYKWTYSVFSYQNHLVKKIIKHAKYNHKSEALLVLAQHSTPYILSYIETLPTTTIVVVPIPQHKSKTQARGFNQAEKIARAIFSAAPAFSIDTQLLKKIHATKPQAQIHTRTIRLQNTKHSMEAMKVCNPNTLYILVDDVLTTGGTLLEAKRALATAGAKHIIGITLAH